MEPITIGIILLVGLLVLIALGMRIAYAAALLGLIGVWLLSGWKGMGGMAGQLPFWQIANYHITLIPLFILMGHFAFYGGITTGLFKVARMWVGHIPGGLPIATTFACAGFAACSGSAIAATALMAKIALPEMLKGGTQPRLAAGAVAASATLATLIPPSTMIVIYGFLTGESIGALLIAGVIPGIVSALIYAGMLYTRCRINPALSPKQPPVPLKTRLVTTGPSIWGLLVIVIVIIGGIYTGIFTPTEAGAIGALGTFLIALGKRTLTWGKLKNSLLETSEITLMALMLIITLSLLNYSLALSGLTGRFADFILSLEVSRYVVLIGFLFVYVLLGMFIGAMGMIILTVPIFVPIVVGLGFDPIWFGIIVIKMVELAGITPPIGMMVFLVHGVAKDIPTIDIFKGAMPFMAMDLLTIALLIAVPQIVTWLPSTM